MIFLKFDGEYLYVKRAFAGNRDWIKITPGTSYRIPFIPREVVVTAISIHTAYNPELLEGRQRKKLLRMNLRDVLVCDYAVNLRINAIYQLDTGYKLRFICMENEREQKTATAV